MDLSKAFDSIPHELLIAKLEAYGLNKNNLKLVYSYLKNRKQSVRINNTYSSFEELVSGVPQGSILGPVLFNFFINDLFLLIKKATLHNYADDNTLSASSDDANSLIKILSEESQIAIEWLNRNHMIANPKKFQGMVISKNKKQIINLPDIKVENTVIQPQNSVKLLGVTIDNDLCFDTHINKLCKSAASQLNALLRLKNFLGFKEKKVLSESFILSNFNYCPLVWHFSSSKSLTKIENIQKRTLQFLYDDYKSSYSDLLSKAKKTTMTISRLRSLCIEVYKTINSLNPSFMSKIFEFNQPTRIQRSQQILNLKVQRANQVKFGERSLRVLGPKIWNSLPPHIKSAQNLSVFKHLIKSWDGVSCKCNLCRSIN